MSETDILDTRGLKCPLPVLKARKRLKSMAPGTVLSVVTDDPAAVIDFPHFCAEAGHSLDGPVDAPAGGDLFRITKAREPNG